MNLSKITRRPGAAGGDELWKSISQQRNPGVRVRWGKPNITAPFDPVSSWE